MTDSTFKITEHTQTLITQDKVFGDFKVNWIYLISQIFNYKWTLSIIYSSCVLISVILAFIFQPKSEYLINTFIIQPTKDQYDKIGVYHDPTHQYGLKHKKNNLSQQQFYPLNKRVFDLFKYYLSKKNEFDNFLKNNKNHNIFINGHKAIERPNNQVELFLYTLNSESATNDVKVFLEYINHKAVAHFINEQQGIIDNKISTLKNEIVMYEKILKNEEITLSPQEIKTFNNHIKRIKIKLVKLESVSFPLNKLTFYKLGDISLSKTLLKEHKKRLYILTGFIIGFLFSFLFLIIKSNLFEEHLKSQLFST